MNAFQLASGLAAEIVTHARECYPEEACGLIAGACNEGLSLHRGRNLAATPRVAFELDPATLARQIEFGEAGLALTGIYHSHPSGPEVPSLVDIAQARYPDAVTIICSLADRKHPVLRAFRIVRGQALEISLVPALKEDLTGRSESNRLHGEELYA